MGSRRALVIGDSSAIGRAIVARLLAKGHRVVGMSRRDEDGLDYLRVVGDAADPAACEQAVEVCAEGGPISVLVTAPGFMPAAPLHDTLAADIDRAVRANLLAVMHPVRAALPRMAEGGAIVVVGTINSVLGAPGVAAYAATKGGLDSLVRQLAVEYGQWSIRVNAVAPGLIARDGDGPVGAELGYPLGRCGDPSDVANAVWFLASEQAAWITGAVLPVDGGLSVMSAAAMARPDLVARRLAPRAGA